MYASKIDKPLARFSANDCRVWNDALQAAVLSLACDEPNPMCLDALLDGDPCVDCQRKDRARELLIKQILELKRPPTN